MFLTTYKLFLLKLIPFYIFILLGYAAGKCLSLEKRTLSSLLVYIVSPIIIFNATLRIDFTIGLLSLPILFFLLCSFICLAVLCSFKNKLKEPTRHLLGYASGSGNVGYFGLPVAIGLFGEDAYPVAILCILGFNLYGNTLGFYIMSKGNLNSKKSLYKLLRLPAVYGCLLGLILNSCGWGIYFEANTIYSTITTQFLSTYSVLGMMIIGLTISEIKRYEFDMCLIIVSLVVKFILWPLLILIVLFINNHLLCGHDPLIKQIMLLLSIVPIAANTVVFATELKVEPEKASLMVLISTAFALLYLPFIMAINAS